MMATVSDLVLVSRLTTLFSSDPEYTQHTHTSPGSTSQQRRIRRIERWTKEKHLGNGSFGTVKLERCIYGDKKGELRAVKSIQKLEAVDYHRELEAIKLFSHEIVCRS
jgi:hypothetical protein